MNLLVFHILSLVQFNNRGLIDDALRFDWKQMDKILACLIMISI